MNLPFSKVSRLSILSRHSACWQQQRGWAGSLKKAGFSDTNVVLLYILAVLVTSRLTEGYAAGLLTSVAATLAFNYFFFTEPYYTLNVNDPAYLITFGIMTGAAVVTSALTSKAKGERDKRPGAGAGDTGPIPVYQPSG